LLLIAEKDEGFKELEGEDLANALSQFPRHELDKAVNTACIAGLRRHACTRTSPIVCPPAMWLCDAHRRLMIEWDKGAMTTEQLQDAAVKLSYGVGQLEKGQTIEEPVANQKPVAATEKESQLAPQKPQAAGEAKPEACCLIG
jgi:hypothetical protein